MDSVVINVTDAPNVVTANITEAPVNVTINVTLGGGGMQCADLPACQTIIDIEQELGLKVTTVSGNQVDNTDPLNPIINTPNLTDVIAEDTDSNNLSQMAALGRKGATTTPSINFLVNFFNTGTGSWLKSDLQAIRGVFNTYYATIYASISSLNLKENKANKVTNFTSPNNTDYATTQATINLVDNRVQSNIKIIGDWDATSGSMPLDDESNTTTFITQWGATIKVGWAFRVGYGQAGAVGGFDYEEGDVVYALIDNAGPTPADWGDLDHNLQQADESLRGTAKVITAAIISDETTTDDERFVTGKKLWLNFWQRVLALSWIWQLKQTFTNSIRISSATASQYLKTDSNKDVVSVSAIPATDITEDSTHRFVTDSEKTNWNTEKNKTMHLNVVDSPTLTGTTANTILSTYSFTANEYMVGDVIRFFVRGRSVGTASFKTIRLYYNTTASLTGATLLSSNQVVGTNISFSTVKNGVIKSATQTEFFSSGTSSDEGVTNTQPSTNINIDYTIPGYFMVAVTNNSAADATVISLFEIQRKRL